MIVNGFGAMRGFGGVQLFNPVLAAAARGALASQGFNPDAISPSGELNPQALLSLAYDRIELRSSLWGDPIVINLNAPSSPAMQALIDRIKPQISFVGRAGRFDIAPYGVAPGVDPDVNKWGGSIGIGIGAGILGLLLIGKALF